MSRVKPYKAKRRLADYAALQEARRLAVAQYLAFPGGRVIAEQTGSIKELVFDVPMLSRSAPPYESAEEEWQIEQARSRAAGQIGRHLISNGFVQETVHGNMPADRRTRFRLLVAKVGP